MEEEAPRLVRSGLILFSSRILSVITGLAFTLMITRNVPDKEYGIWTNINIDIIAYFTFLSTIFPFWIMRFVARKHEGSAKTGVIANLLFGLVSTLFYIFLVPFILPLLGADVSYLQIYLLASAQIIPLYLVSVFESVLRVIKIEALSYGLILEEVTRVFLGYLLIIHQKMGLQGAVLALVFGFSIQTVFYLYVARRSLKGEIRWSYVKEWVKGSFASLYNIIGQRIAALSLILLIIICGDEGFTARAYYGASSQIAMVISHSRYLIFALYPRLLILKNSDDVAESFKLFFMFALPMTAGIVVLADSFLTVLGKGVIAGKLVDYSVATPVLRLLALTTFVLSISQVFNAIIFGTEKFDLEAKIPLRRLIRSRIFILFTLPYIRAAIVLPALLFILPFFSNDPVRSAQYTALLVLITETALLMVRYLLIRREEVTFVFPWKNVLKYLFASIVMSAFLLLINHPARILTVIFYTSLGGIIYLAILLVIDKDARVLAKAIIAEIMRILGFTSNDG